MAADSAIIIADKRGQDRENVHHKIKLAHDYLHPYVKAQLQSFSPFKSLLRLDQPFKSLNVRFESYFLF